MKNSPAVQCAGICPPARRFLRSASGRRREAAFLFSLAGVPVLGLLPGGTGVACAQIDAGSVTGTVMDATGAVIPGAEITLTNPQVKVTLTTRSTETGTYSFVNVRPGRYILQTVAPGFKKFTSTGVDVHIQDTQTLDVRLTNGMVTEEVQVTAAAPLLQAENGEVGQTITSQTVNDLPLQTRNWASLSQLSAGVTTAPVGQPSADSGSSTSAFFVVNGANLWQNDFRLNGINDNIEMYGGASVLSNAAITPPPDALQEFKLQAIDYSAEFGHSTGSVVNATTKSGTNRFHGDLWEYVRNDIFNANLFFNKLNGVSRPEYRQNIYGATLGGPIFRDRTFFFVSYQGQRYVLPAPATSTVPTNAMVSSGFTNLQDLINFNSGTGTDALGRVFPHGTVLDPATTRSIAGGAVDAVTGLKNPGSGTIYVRDPFYNGSVVGKTNYVGNTAQLNMIPQNRLDANAVRLLGVYPTQNQAGLSNNYYFVPKQLRNISTYDARIDQHFNANNLLYGTFDLTMFDASVPPALPGFAVGQSGARNDSFPAYSVAGSYTHIFSATLTNEMHFGGLHAEKLQRSIYGNTFGIPAQFGIQGIPQVSENGGLPPISISGLTKIGVGGFTPTLQYTYSIEGADSVTKQYRNHLFKTGIQVDSIQGNISQPPQGRGNVSFNGQYSDIPNKNSSLTGITDLLLTPMATTAPGGVNNVGGISSFSGSNISSTNDHRWYSGAFFQDDWKATPTLTLNLGLRYDYFTPYKETSGRQANLVTPTGNGPTGTYYISNQGCQVPRSPSFDALLGSNNIAIQCVADMDLGHAQKTNFSPRIGFAYRATKSLVIRSGFGLAYGALGNLGYGGTLGTNYPFVYTTVFNSPDSQHPLTLPSGSTAQLENTFNEINIGNPAVNSGNGLNLYGRVFNYQTPVIEQQNLTVQEQFTRHDSLQIGYIGTQGRHLDNLGYNNSPSQILPTSVNAQLYVPFPSFARNATYETTNATSSYNSLQATYQRQQRDGLSLLVNYTYSKCLTDQHTQASQNSQYRAEWLASFGIRGDYGLCDSDSTNVTHASGTYELPFGRGKSYLSSVGKIVNDAIGNFTVNAIYTFQQGQPFTIGCPVSTSNFGCFANTVQGANLYAGPHNYTRWLNPAALSQPAQAMTIGQSDTSPLGGGPQQARGPHYANLDLSLLKNINFSESFYLQLRAEAFNATNTTPFSNPGNLNFTTTNFATITGERNGGDGPRRLQFAVKLFY